METKRIGQNWGVWEVLLTNLADELHGGVRGRERSNIAPKVGTGGGRAGWKRGLRVLFLPSVCQSPIIHAHPPRMPQP